MNAMDHSWTDESQEVTQPADVLRLSGERRAADSDTTLEVDLADVALGELEQDEVLPVEMFLEDDWDDESGWDEAGLVASFYVAGPLSRVIRSTKGRFTIAKAQGIAKRLEDDRLVLGIPGSPTDDVTLGYRLPASVDLRGLVGRRVRLTLEEETRPGGRIAQTLTIRTLDDRVWLLARQGISGDTSHELGGTPVRVSLAPKAAGPLVVSTRDLEHIVATGGEAHIRAGGSRYVVELVSRDDAGAADYFIADDRLWH